MHYLTGYYGDDAPGASLVLAQAKRITDNQPIVLAGVWDALEDSVVSEGVGQNGFGNRLLEWFDRQGLPLCTKGTASKCIRAVGKAFAKWYEGYGRKELDGMSSCGKTSWSVFVSVGEECFYAWNGDGEIYLLNLCFNRLNRRKLTWHTNEMQIAYAGLEPGVGILLGGKSFFEFLPEAGLKECLAVASMENHEQVERHLKEAVLDAADRGAKYPLAVLAVTKEE